MIETHALNIFSYHFTHRNFNTPFRTSARLKASQRTTNLAWMMLSTHRLLYKFSSIFCFFFLFSLTSFALSFRSRKIRCDFLDPFIIYSQLFTIVVIGTVSQFSCESNKK